MKHDTEYICMCNAWDEPVLYPIAELVRCKDCKYYDDVEWLKCPMLEPTEKDDYCSWAERKTDD